MGVAQRRQDSRFERLKLQLPPDRCRPHYFKARVKVRRHMDGTLSV